MTLPTLCMGMLSPWLGGHRGCLDQAAPGRVVRVVLAEGNATACLSRSDHTIMLCCDDYRQDGCLPCVGSGLGDSVTRCLMF